MESGNRSQEQSVPPVNGGTWKEGEKHVEEYLESIMKSNGEIDLKRGTWAYRKKKAVYKT